MRIVGAAVEELMKDAWAPEDVWLILLWHQLMVKGRRKVFDAIQAFKASTKEQKEEEGAKAEEKFEGSFLDWCEGPMQAILNAWIVLYLWDNGTKMLEVPAMLSGVGAAIDVGMYMIAFGAINIMVVNKFGPKILAPKVPEIALQLVITRLINIVIFVAVALKVGFLFGVPPASILGLGGVGGLTFGLAAKDVFSNLIGGTTLALLRPFSVGEEIFVTASGNFRGSDNPNVANYTVKHIGWYQTTLIAKDTLVTLVPNSYFIGANIINVTRSKARVCIFDFRILYQDRRAVPTITEDIRQFLFKNKLVDSVNFPVRVHFIANHADAVVVRVECHVFKKSLTEFFDDKQEIMMDTLDIVDKHTSGVAYPTEVQLKHLLLDYPAQG